jgi:transposase InsO family protein
MWINNIVSIEQINYFLNLECPTKISEPTKKVYSWMNRLLNRLNYHHLKKKEKSLVLKFILKMTGYSYVQLKRLLSKHKQGKLKWVEWERKNIFIKKYSDEDIKLLNQVDKAHQMSGNATQAILKRECEIFHKDEYSVIKEISVSHMYNLRNTYKYKCLGTVFDHTIPTQSHIGIRKKPRPNGKPGYLRVDSVHQGRDEHNHNGVYWITLVDEVTQNTFIFCAPNITDNSIKYALDQLNEQCYFKIINFHSDNGKEYINQVVAQKLEGMRIMQTKSRSRKTNDNALAESKNAWIVRKTFGYAFIQANDYNVKLLNDFCIQYLIPYTNFHRPAGFATTTADQHGKEKKIYDKYKTPYEAFKSLTNANQYLKEGITLAQLDKIAYAMSDTNFAEQKNKIFKKIFASLIIVLRTSS